MWLTSVDIVSTPRRARRDAEVAALAVLDVDGDRAAARDFESLRHAALLSQAGNAFVGEQIESGADGPLVALDVLGAVGGDRLAHALDERVTRHDPGCRGVCAEHHHRTRERVAEIGRDSRGGDTLDTSRRRGSRS